MLLSTSNKTKKINVWLQTKSASVYVINGYVLAPNKILAKPRKADEQRGAV